MESEKQFSTVNAQLSIKKKGWEIKNKNTMVNDKLLMVNGNTESETILNSIEKVIVNG